MQREPGTIPLSPPVKSCKGLRPTSRNYEFSRATVEELWQGGHADVQKVLEHPEACRVTDLGNGVRVFDL